MEHTVEVFEDDESRKRYEERCKKSKVEPVEACIRVELVMKGLAKPDSWIYKRGDMIYEIAEGDDGEVIIAS